MWPLRHTSWRYRITAQAIRAPLQRRMIEASPCASVTELDTDHSPFFSARGELVAALAALA